MCQLFSLDLFSLFCSLAFADFQFLRKHIRPSKKTKCSISLGNAGWSKPNLQFLWNSLSMGQMPALQSPNLTKKHCKYICFFFFEKSSFEVHRSRMTFGYSWVNRPLFYLTIVDYRMMFRFLLFRLLGERQMSYYLETHSLALTELF